MKNIQSTNALAHTLNNIHAGGQKIQRQNTEFKESFDTFQNSEFLKSLKELKASIIN